MTVRVERRRRPRLQRVLVVDDEEDIRLLLALTLGRMGLESTCVGTLEEARSALQANSFALCLTDMRLPDGSGLELVTLIAEQYPELPCAVITAHGSMENAVEALKAGAFDYLAKPVSVEPLRALVKSALSLPGQTSEGGGAVQIVMPQLIGSSEPIVQARALIARIARSQAPVHIFGESGTGKECAARLIHAGGARAAHPFVAVNCGAIPDNLMESEFFGYRKGAFTGADSDRPGFFQAAQGGTLFLDEIGDLPAMMQVKLLRVIQEKKVRPVGATLEEAVDVRIVSATHRRLRQLVDEGRFRSDLYFRLNVVELHMPSLRDCREDLPLLVEHILGRIAASGGPKISHAAMGALSRYPFPGNVRELENILERALTLAPGPEIDVADLGLTPPTTLPTAVPSDAGGEPLQEYLDRVEREAISSALQTTRYNRTAAAKLLGVTFRSLRYRMERLGLND